MDAQNQYGSAPRLTSTTTPRPDRPVRILVAISVLLSMTLVAAPGEIHAPAASAVFGVLWLTVVLAMTLPNRSEFEERERTRRLAQFRHELNAIGDSPTIEAVKGVIRRASELRLEEGDVREELLELRACVDGLELQARLGRGELPAADAPDPLAPGDTCHFACPVRFGRRRADQIGHLVLTSGWLKFRGALDVSVAWSEVASVARDGREIVIGLQDSRRILRFACHSIGEAARGGVLASYLARKARMDTRPDPTTSHASW